MIEWQQLVAENRTLQEQLAAERETASASDGGAETLLPQVDPELLAAVADPAACCNFSSSTTSWMRSADHRA
jgi:hypothetical protein